MADILFVALISRNTRPLYMQMFEKGQKNESLDGDQARSAEQTSGEATKEDLSHKENREAGSFLKYNFLAHMALDVFAAPLALAAREPHVPARRHHPTELDRHPGRQLLRSTTSEQADRRPRGPHQRKPGLACETPGVMVHWEIVKLVWPWVIEAFRRAVASS